MSDKIAAQALVLLNTARTVADSVQRTTLLHQLHELLKKEPALLGTFYPHALGLAVDPSPDFRVGLIRLIEDTICRTPIPDEVKMIVSARSIEGLTFLMNDGNPAVLKRVIRCSTCICKLPTDVGVWQGLVGLKLKVFAVLGHLNDGVKECVVRFLYKLITIQSPKDASVISTGTDAISLDLVPSTHPFVNSQELNAEAVGLFNRMQALLSTAGITAGPITANINCMLDLTKTRPQYLQAAVSTLIQWTTVATPHLTVVQRRSVERTIKVALLSILRTPAAAPYATILTEVLTRLGIKPHELHQARRRDLKRSVPSSASASMESNKRARLGSYSEPAAAASSGQQNAQEDSSILANRILSSVDFSALPSTLVAELVVQILASCAPERWEAGLTRFRQLAAGAARPVHPQIAELVPTRGAEVPRPEQEVKSGDGPQTGRLSENQASVPSLGGADTDEFKPTLIPVEQKTEESMELSTANDAVTLLPSDDATPAPLSSDAAEASARAMVFKISDTDITELSVEQRRDLLNAAIKRIIQLESSFTCRGPSIGSSTRARGGAEHQSAERQSIFAAKSAWMVILSRLTTALSECHGSEDISETGDQQIPKRLIMESLLEDFRARLELALCWLHHLWLEDERKCRLHANNSLSAAIGDAREYPTWFHMILQSLREKLDPKDKTFAKFLIDVPEVTEESIDCVVRSYCDDDERMQLGLFTLQGLVNHRPAIREKSLALLLEYTLHPVKIKRSTAIVMCKRFFSDHRNVGAKVETFALEAIRRLLEPPPTVSESRIDDTTKADVEIDELEKEASQIKNEASGTEDAPIALDDTDAVSAMDSPTSAQWLEDDVIRHLELYFALCSKKHELLLELFKLYKDFPISVQRAVRHSIHPLIKALRSQLGRLVPIIRAFPPGSEQLMLRTLIILTENDAPSPQLVAAVRTVFQNRNLDARFLIPILTALDRHEVLQHLPKIVQLLDGTDKHRKIVREAFLRLVNPQSSRNMALAPAGGTGVGPFPGVAADRAPPSGGTGSPLTPSELLVALHNMEDTVGLKRAVEATSICFTCQTVFKQEVLAVVLQQLVDQSKLPTLFMRTVIQCVNQYPGLVNFVTNILLKLINKKVWTSPKLWEGFIRCCTIIFPASLQALQSLPRTYLTDALSRSPKLKASLQAHLTRLGPDQLSRREIQQLSALVEIDGGPDPNKAEEIDIKMEKS